MSSKDLYEKIRLYEIKVPEGTIDTLRDLADEYESKGDKRLSLIFGWMLDNSVSRVGLVGEIKQYEEDK